MSLDRVEPELHSAAKTFEFAYRGEIFSPAQVSAKLGQSIHFTVLETAVLPNISIWLDVSLPILSSGDSFYKIKPLLYTILYK